MLQNKIYQNFLIEIIKNFLLTMLGFTLIALTVRAVSFLDLIVENGYSVSTYFKYSILNIFGIAPKFFLLSFLISLTLFIIKHIQSNELVILWTSGVKKIQIANLFLLISLIILSIYLFLSVFISPFALHKSRNLLSDDGLNSLGPVIKSNQFSDAFEGLTFVVDKKNGNEIKNIFLNDKGKNLKNLSSNIEDISETTIIAKSGLTSEKSMILFNGIIISSKKDNSEDEIIKFEQLNTDLSQLKTTTIKKPKVQELSTLKLLECFFKKNNFSDYCNENFKKEVISVLGRRIVTPIYLPVLSLICSILLINSKNFFTSRISIFFFSFILIVFTELVVRYIGMNSTLLVFFILFPILLLFILYFFLFYNFQRESTS